MNTELLLLILKYHAGQVRVGNREDGTPDPQIEHLFRVFAKLLQPCAHYPKSLRLVRQNATDMMLDVALAHDLLEDTEVTEEELAGVINIHALESLKALTRDKDEDYFDYIKDLLSNPLASLVKLADLEDNYENAIPSLQKRYSKAKEIILDHWNNVVFPEPAEEDFPGEEPGAEKQEEEEEKTTVVLSD